MLRLLNCPLFQNFRILQRAQVAALAYQFRVIKPVYYPDRAEENNRMREQQQSQLVTDTCKQDQIKLPKDYYYTILGVGTNSTTQEIKTAYYTLAKRLHPDAAHNSHASKRFQEVSNAYHILTDEAKRMEYDQLGIIKGENEFLRSVPEKSRMSYRIDKNINIKNVKGIAGQPGGEDESAIPTAAATATTKEALMQVNSSDQKIDLTFLEAAQGIKKKIDLRFLKKCPTCGGRSQKLASRTEPEPCRRCGGNGKVVRRTATYRNLVPCESCQGKGLVNRNQCNDCDNRGFIIETVKVDIPITAGTKSGDSIAIENPITKKRVKYRFNVQEHDYYNRSGIDVHTNKYITISEAVLGGTFTVRGLDGIMEVKVPAGTESHTQITLPGKGIKTQEAVGNHIVTIKVRIPRALSMKQRQLMLALAKTEDPNFDQHF